METTGRLALPMLLAGQAQKEVFHNEALQILDVVTAAAVEEGPRNDPPTAPAAGECYIVGAAPTGAWSGHEHQMAAFTAGGWRFIAPVAGMTALVKSDQVTATFRAIGWEVGTMRGNSLEIGGTQVVGEQAGAVADPAGGTTIDAEARVTLAQLLAALRIHGLIASS